MWKIVQQLLKLLPRSDVSVLLNFIGQSSHTVTQNFILGRYKLIVCLEGRERKIFGEFSSVQSLSRVRLFATPWTVVYQASLSITKSQSLLKLMSIESVISNHLFLCHPLLLLPSIFPSIRVFYKESALCIRWAKVLEFQLQHQFFQ